MKVNQMRIPLIYTPYDILHWTVIEEYEPNKWRPTRVCGFNYWSVEWIKYRFRILWGVFIGKYDVLYWGSESGEKTNKEINYKDLLDKDFKILMGKRRDRKHHGVCWR
jgi:hypothetical protein